METKFVLGEKVKVGSSILEIVKVDKFGCTPHYGIFIQDHSDPSNPKFSSGWIPVTILDQIGNK